MVNGEEVKDVEEFAYLGAIVEKKGGGSKDIRNRMQKARGAFQRLWKVHGPTSDDDDDDDTHHT